MNKIILALSFSLTGLFAHSALAAHDYACIAQRLDAYNSDIYYDLSAQDIDELLQSKTDGRSDKAIEVAKICDDEQAAKACGGFLKAEFTGVTSNVLYYSPEAGQYEHSNYGIHFKTYKADATCPLQKQDADNAVLSIEGAEQIQDGQAISGTLLYNAEYHTYSLQK